MRLTILMGALALPLAACSTYGGSGYGYGGTYGGSGYGYGGGARPAGDRYLGDNDVIYRDTDGRYYCKRPDGTTGAIVGGLAGGVLGNVIAPGGSKTLGTILGAGAGALAGREIDRRNVRCE